MSIVAEGYCIGPYRIIRRLGEGGMGVVYEARQEPLNRRVAMKTLHTEYAKNADAIARFFSEAKVLSFLAHPSLVQVSDFGYAADGTAYLVMEYLDGQSLSQLLATMSPQLRLLDALQLAWQIADVLTIAHAHGIVHRDLKPENLMLVADPVAPGGQRVKVLDFGIAKLIPGSELGSAKTDLQAVLGTPLYMSPEQCAGAGAVDEKTDVYSLGCVLYQVLSGRPPFMAEGAGAIMGMHLFHRLPPLVSLAPEVPTAVAALVERLLSKPKEHRPSMAETAKQLATLQSELTAAAPKERWRHPLRSAHAVPMLPGQPREARKIAPPLRPRIPVGSAAAWALAAATMTVWALGDRPRTPTPSRLRTADAAAASPRAATSVALPPPAAPPPPELPPASPEAPAAAPTAVPRLDKPRSAASGIRAAKGSPRPAAAADQDADISSFFPKK